MRQSELLDLKWQDVDMENKIGVRRMVIKSGEHLLLGEPKTKKSHRTLQLTWSAVEARGDHFPTRCKRSNTSATSTKVGAWSSPARAASSSTLQPAPAILTPLLKRAKLPQIRFHDLRHTCATLLLSRNVNPKVVSEMLGHANIAITLDIYSHVSPDMQEKAAKILKEALR